MTLFAYLYIILISNSTNVEDNIKLRRNKKMKVYGYARISTDRQNIERQVRNILKVNPEAEIIEEIFTGKSINRPEFDKLLKRVKTGDTVIFDSVSRMSRNAVEGFELYKELYSKGVNLIFVKEPLINTETYKNELKKQIKVTVNTGETATDSLINTIISALNKYILALAEKQFFLAFEQSQKEVDDLRQRTKEGIETARKNGKQIGGYRGKRKAEKPIKDLILKWSKSFGGSLKDRELIALINGTTGLHISNNTYYKYKRECSNSNVNA